MNKLIAILTLTLLTACGGGGGGSSNTTPKPPSNRTPTANFTASCVDLECTFTDSSTDSDGTITTYLWDFGDSTTSPNADIVYSYADYGTYTVKLTVTDNDGASGSKSSAVEVVIDIHSQIAIIDTNHSSALFSVDFNNRPEGAYTGLELLEDFDCPANWISNEVWCSDTNENVDEFVIQNSELKVTMSAGTEATDNTYLSFTKHLGDNYNELYLTYNLRLDNNYDDTNTGFKVMGIGGAFDYGQLPGGGSGTNGEDGGFNSRYVVNDGQFKQYYYHPNQAGQYGDSSYVSDFTFHKDTDYVIEMRVKMNTPGQANGEIETFVNGVSVILTEGLVFSGTGSYGINQFGFNLQADGGNSFSTPSTVYLDDFVVSTERVVTAQ